MVAMRRLADDSINLFHFGCGSDDVSKTLLRLYAFPQCSIFTLETQMVGDSLQEQTQLVLGEGLHDVVIGAFLHRLDRRLYRCETSHDDHYQIRTPLSQFCLLYTSDAADERSSVDLGGRR